MLKHQIKDSGYYWGVSFNSSKDRVLIQLDEDDGDSHFQVRIALTLEEAKSFQKKLFESIKKIES